MSTLSGLESGIRRPTLELLIPLARAHHVALDQLVAAPATGDPRVHLKPFRRRRGNTVVPLTQYPGRVQVFKQVLAPSEPRLVTHEGYEWLYVLSGELRLILGEAEFTLHPGEVAEFDTREPHWFGPSGAIAVEVLHLFGPYGDQAVIRAGSSRNLVLSQICPRRPACTRTSSCWAADTPETGKAKQIFSNGPVRLWSGPVAVMIV